MNNKKLQSSSAIFLAAVLVAGVIAITSPISSFAEEYGYEKKKYDSYDPPYKKDMKSKYYDPEYKSEKKYQKPGYKYNGAECYVSNFNIGQVSQFEADIVNNWLRQSESSSASSDINSLGGDNMGGSIGLENNNEMDRNGGGGITLEIENFCFNAGDNANSGTVGSVP